MAEFKLKCVVCGHRETRELAPGAEELYCSQCFGPVTVQRGDSTTVYKTGADAQKGAAAVKFNVFRPGQITADGVLEFPGDLGEDDADLVSMKCWLAGFLPDTGRFEARKVAQGWSVHDARTDTLLLSLEE